MSSGTGLAPRDHAAFAVTSRLLSCIVTEQLLPAFYVSTPHWQGTSGIMIISSTPFPLGHLPHSATGVFAIIPLRQAPVLFQGRQMDRKHGKLIGLVDPLEMKPRVFVPKLGLHAAVEENFFHLEMRRALQKSSWDLSDYFLCETSDPLVYWERLSDLLKVVEPARGVIREELLSSLTHQCMSYTRPPGCPTIRSPPIQWEQSLVAGHPTHPMHRARLHPSADLDYDWYRPTIRFVQVRRECLDLRGPFEAISQSLVSKAVNSGTGPLNHHDFIYMPVHELQLPIITKLFPDVEVVPAEAFLRAQAQTSIRTVLLDELPGFALKIGVGVKISSSLRTISHFTTDFGPRFSAEVVPKLNFDRNILVVETEPASAIHRVGDPDVRKHFTAVLRQEYTPRVNENVIIVAALLETDHANTPPGAAAVTEIFGLDTERKRIDFLDRYIELSCKALLPPLIHNGVAFEAHAQNVLVRVDTSNKTITGFVIRDLGGLRIHPPTLCKSIGVNFEFLPNHCIATKTVQDIYPKFYHTYVHNHIQRLTRLLNLHHNGVGWELLRRHMDAAIPVDHELRTLWLSPQNSTVESKCLMRMRLQDSYRDNIYCPIPNLIQFKPDYLDHRRESML